MPGRVKPRSLRAESAAHYPLLTIHFGTGQESGTETFPFFEKIVAATQTSHNTIEIVPSVPRFTKLGSYNSQQHGSGCFQLHSWFFKLESHGTLRDCPSIMDYLDAAKTIHAACVRGKKPERLQPVVPCRGALAPGFLILPYVYQNTAGHTFADLLFLAIAHFTSIAKADVSPDLKGSRPTFGSSSVAPGKWHSG